ncbi:hypothetical protein PG984_007511 [Apiospora sp. TS-2023a]
MSPTTPDRRALVEQWDDKRPDGNGKTILAVNMEEISAPKEVYIAVGVKRQSSRENRHPFAAKG